MPKERNYQFPVLQELQELSRESDKLAEQFIPNKAALEEYFTLFKETALKIARCASVAGVRKITFPPDMKTYFGEKPPSSQKNIEIAISEKEHVHAERTVNTDKEINAKKAEEPCDKNLKVLSNTVEKIPRANFFATEELQKSPNKNETFTSVASYNAIDKTPLLPQISAVKLEIQNCSVKSTHQNNSCTSQGYMETPVLNRKFTSVINKTVILNSASSCDSNQKLNVKNHSGMSILGSKPKLLLSNLEKKTPSGNKRSSSASKNKTVMGENEADDIRITRSASKQLQQSGSKMQTRRSKRSSSADENKSSKKQKREMSGVNVSSTSSSKPVKSKQAKHKRNILKPMSQLTNGNKPAIVHAVVVPTKKNPSLVIPKEKHIMEEIQKREERANENLKKVLAERQNKAEENKRKRTEKMETILQKRLLLEKERQERLEKESIKTQSSVKENSKKTQLRTRAKEQNEQHVQENPVHTNPGILTASKKNETNADVIKTPNRKISTSDSNKSICSYELTPVPDSSTYDFSDDDDDAPSGKPIPSWATGVHLKNNLIQQFYSNIDTDEIFGICSNQTPDLAAIFGVQKKIYFKRTSSAVWK